MVKDQICGLGETIRLLYSGIGSSVSQSPTSPHHAHLPSQHKLPGCPVPGHQQPAWSKGPLLVRLRLPSPATRMSLGTASSTWNRRSGEERRGGVDRRASHMGRLFAPGARALRSSAALLSHFLVGGAARYSTKDGKCLVDANGSGRLQHRFAGAGALGGACDRGCICHGLVLYVMAEQVVARSGADATIRDDCSLDRWTGKRGLGKRKDARPRLRCKRTAMPGC